MQNLEKAKWHYPKKNLETDYSLRNNEEPL